MTRWTGLALLVTVLLAPAVGAQGPGRRGPESPVLIDAGGRVVGPVVGLSGLLLLRVGISVGGRVSAVQVGRDRFVSGSGVVAFETSGCTGAPFLIPSVVDTSDLYREAGIGPGNALYGVVGSPESRTIAARWTPGASPECTPEAPTGQSVLPVVKLVDLDTFEPPFHVE